VLQAISPYFAVDFLLPRTYVASLSFYHLSNKIDIELLPTDAVLGAVCYFIKINISRHLPAEKCQVCNTESSLRPTSVIVLFGLRSFRFDREIVHVVVFILWTILLLNFFLSPELFL
jgi:hypothetical protein